jgi:hypothetical protein
VAGLGKASELAGVVGALVALAGLGLAGYGLALGHDSTIDSIEPDGLHQGITGLTKGGGRPVIVDAIAPSPPWTVRGHGLIYSVIKVTRTMSGWGGDEKPSITVTADVTRTKPSDYHRLQYRFSDEESGIELKRVPFEDKGSENPSLNQRSRLVTVLWDVDPPITRLTITLHDFFWPDGKDLILKGVPVPPMRREHRG